MTSLQNKTKTNAARAKRTLDKIDRLSVKIVSVVAGRVNHNGEMEDFDGIEAAREVRELIVKVFAGFNRDRVQLSGYQPRKRING